MRLYWTACIPLALFVDVVGLTDLTRDPPKEINPTAQLILGVPIIRSLTLEEHWSDIVHN